MIQLNHISISHGVTVILNDINWNIKDGSKIGLYGLNGSGKTILLNIIAGKTSADSGAVSSPLTTNIGYLPQELLYSNPERSVIEEVLSSFETLHLLDKKADSLLMSLEEMDDSDSIEYKMVLNKIEDIQKELTIQDSHLMRVNSEKILTGLGFEQGDFERRLSEFSGGWRMRIELAKILAKRPNVLLLDEPTNHLDIESIEWLEWYLKRYKGTLVLVSHDKYFLDRIIKTVVELENGKLTEYTGNYSFYIKQKDRLLISQREAFLNQQKQIKQINRFIEKFRYKASKAKQVQSRIKMLDKMEMVPEPRALTETINFEFPLVENSGKTVLEISEFSKTYDLEDGNKLDIFINSGPLSILRGDKVALIGKNGIGKSTLARIILGSDEFNGKRKLGYQVGISYFSQGLSGSLNPENTIFEELKSASIISNETYLRSILGALLFSGDDVNKKIKVLSGGEKSRVALGKSLVNPSNFLILDEPTNHLDIISRNILVKALNKYTGTFLLISHDRNFIEEVSNKIWYIENQKVHSFPGKYSEYLYHIAQTYTYTEHENDHNENSMKYGIVSKSDLNNFSLIDTKKNSAELRNRRYRELKEFGIENMENWKELSIKQLKNALGDLEQKIETCERKKLELENLLNDNELFKDVDESKNVSTQYREISQRLEKMYKRWDSISAHFEQSNG